MASSLAAVDAADWDACACPAVESVSEADESDSQHDRDNPFIRHAFLLALEESGSAVGRTGWSGAHLLVKDAAGALLACAPAYLKSHSQGEYVFDHS
ncbi:MAG: peptidogalycan biosysnthesis protein, partial [Alsobacter sp.]